MVWASTNPPNPAGMETKKMQKSNIAADKQKMRATLTAFQTTTDVPLAATP